MNKKLLYGAFTLFFALGAFCGFLWGYDKGYWRGFNNAQEIAEMQELNLCYIDLGQTPGLTILADSYIEQVTVWTPQDHNWYCGESSSTPETVTFAPADEDAVLKDLQTMCEKNPWLIGFKLSWYFQGNCDRILHPVRTMESEVLMPKYQCDYSYWNPNSFGFLGYGEERGTVLHTNGFVFEYNGPDNILGPESTNPEQTYLGRPYMQQACYTMP